MAIKIERALKGSTQTLYAKIKGVYGTKTAIWAKVGFFWDQESAEDTKVDHELDIIEVPFVPDFSSSLNFWEQAYAAVKAKMESLGYVVLQDV